MQTVEMYFNDTIEKYRQLKQDTFLLIADIPMLSPIEIGSRCGALTMLQREIADDNEQLCLLMEDIGPEILETAYIGEYQRAMDKSIRACDSLQAEMRVHRDRIHCLS
jgi:hypothetical protein